TDSNREITFWNKAAEELYGWKSEEVIGKKASEVLMPEGNEKK
ncbi:PAS domain-containing protein, partial [Mesotoga sp.]